MGRGRLHNRFSKMIVKIDKQIIKFKIKHNQDYVRVFFDENKMNKYIKSLLKVGKNVEPFDKLILDFSKPNIFLIVDEKYFAVNNTKDSSWCFFKILYEGKIFWARSEMFENI